MQVQMNGELNPLTLAENRVPFSLLFNNFSNAIFNNSRGREKLGWKTVAAILSHFAPNNAVQMKRNHNALQNNTLIIISHHSVQYVLSTPGEIRTDTLMRRRNVLSNRSPSLEHRMACSGVVCYFSSPVWGQNHVMGFF